MGFLQVCGFGGRRVVGLRGTCFRIGALGYGLDVLCCAYETLHVVKAEQQLSCSETLTGF